MIADGTTHVLQSEVSIAIASDEEVDRFRIEIASRQAANEAYLRDHGRRARKIQGTVGIHAGKVDGIYEATDEESGGMPVYRKQGDDDMWLMYHAPKKFWIVQQTVNKNSNMGKS